MSGAGRGLVPYSSVAPVLSSGNTVALFNSATVHFVQQCTTSVGILLAVLEKAKLLPKK